MPLSILQIEKFDTLIWKILTLLMVPYLAFFGAKKKDIMILEYGIDYPWEMDKLLSIVKPDIGIMTQLDSVHSLQFWDPTAIAKEEIKMVKNTKDVVFLNYDDDYAKQLIWKLKSDQITYWINSQEWQIKIANLDYQFNPELSWGKVFTQWIISVNKKNLVISTNLIGRENFIYVWLALNIFDIINYRDSWKSIFANWDNESFELDYQLQPWRCTIFEGVNDSVIVDSSYNASPKSMRVMVDLTVNFTRSVMKNYKTMLFLWDMRELWDFTEKEHRLLAWPLSQSSDFIVLVWDSMINFCYDELTKIGYDTEKIRCFTNSEEAWEFIKNKISEDWVKRLILAKWSQNTIFLEEWIKHFIKNKSDRKTLSRQSRHRLQIKHKYFNQEK